MLSHTEIIENFGKIMVGYLLVMERSEFVTKSIYIDIILYNGANIIIHVFTMLVANGHAIDNILNQCYKSYLCYLEYIEQIDKSNLANNLYISDISTFVYKTVLGELHTSSSHNNERMPEQGTSILTGEDKSTPVNPQIPILIPSTRVLVGVSGFTEETTNEFRRMNVRMTKEGSTSHVIDLLVKNWNTLIAWNSSFSLPVKIAIIDIHLVKYTKLFYEIMRTSERGTNIFSIETTEEFRRMNDKSHIFRNYLETIQQKWQLDEELYFMLLNEYYKELYKMNKKNMIPCIREKQMLLLTLYDYIERPTRENIHTIV